MTRRADHAAARVGATRSAPVRREVLTRARRRLRPTGRPPVLFVPGFGHGAWAFAEHWLEHAAGRGFPAYAMSLRGHGDSGAAPEADAARVRPRRGPGGRRPAAPGGAGRARRRRAGRGERAGPLPGPGRRAGRAGLRRAGRRWRRRCARNPFGTLPARVRRPAAAAPRAAVQPRAAGARGPRVRRPARPGVAPRAQWQLLLHRAPERAGRRRRRCWWSAARTTGWCRARRWSGSARRYGGAPLLFPGMGHDLMLDARWREPIDAILDWLDKELAAAPLSLAPLAAAAAAQPPACAAGAERRSCRRPGRGTGRQRASAVGARCGRRAGQGAARVQGACR